MLYIPLNRTGINSTPSYLFPSRERLKSRKQIARLFKEGKSFHISPFKLYYVTDPAMNGLQAGFGASARNFKKATDRNRIKRVAREAYRLQKKELEQALQNKQTGMAVFFIYTGRELPLFDAVKATMQAGLQKLVKMVHEKIPAHT